MSHHRDRDRDRDYKDKDKVIVYVLSSDYNSPKTRKVLSMFNNSLFKGHVVSISPPNDFVVPPNLNSKDALESYRFNHVLNDAANKYPDNHIVITKDTSTSNAGPDRIAHYIKAAQDKGGWDIFYLCRWGDKCESYDADSHDFVKSSYPRGTQAMMFSPQGRDILLGKKPMKNGQPFPSLVADDNNLGQNRPVLDKSLSDKLQEETAKNNIDAVCLKDNLVNYDITNAKSANDFNKVSQCGTHHNSNRYDQSSGSNWILWIFIIIVVLLILFWIMRRNRTIVV